MNGEALAWPEAYFCSSWKVLLLSRGCHICHICPCRASGTEQQRALELVPVSAVLQADLSLA